MIGRQIRSVEKSRFQHPGSLSLPGGPLIKNTITLYLFVNAGLDNQI